MTGTGVSPYHRISRAMGCGMENVTARDVATTADMDRLRHALMNPLTVVVGYAQLIASNPDLDPETRSRANLILAQATECVRILETWKRGEAGSDVPGERGSRPPSQPRRGRVLVVDDEPIIRTLARQVLGSAHDVAVCESGEEALRRVMVEDFDAILIDLNLSGPMTGRALYETLQERHPELAHRVVLMSGGVVTERDARFLEQVGRPYIQKPFNIAEIRALVERVVSS